jgi:hypothetical protein
MQRKHAFLMDWLRESRWRTHVIVAARCVDPAQSHAISGQKSQQSIGVQRTAALESRGAAGYLLPPAGRIATFTPS